MSFVPRCLRAAGVTRGEWARWRLYSLSLSFGPLFWSRCSWCGRLDYILGFPVGHHPDCPPF